jgi:endonuclease/exonuclease/phosphatase (EEP) superfamily protein YafD
LALAVAPRLLPGPLPQPCPPSGAQAAWYAGVEALSEVERPLDILLTIAELAAITFTVLPLVRRGAWWIRIFDFPRIQITVVSALILAADFAFRTDAGPGAHVLRAVLIFAILYQAHKIRPYTILAGKQVEAAKKPRKETTLSLALANVKMGNRNSALLRDILLEAGPDVILILEADQWWRRELGSFVKTHPFTLQQPQDNFYGMLLFSRVELVRPEVRFLVEKDVPSMHAGVKLPGGSEVELYCLHPKPPVPQESGQSTERDAELMIVGKEVERKDLPTVVFGDLNDVAWSHTTLLFQKISRLVDPRIGRGLYNSFHASYLFLRFPLDHFFHSTHFRLIELKRLAYFGSDHFPMYVRLSCEPEAQRQQKTPAAGASDHSQAREKIEEAGTDG